MKHLYFPVLSLFSIAFISTLFSCSSSVKLNCNSISKETTKDSASSNYVELVDGDKVFGQTINRPNASFIMIDNDRYDISEIKGYYENETYFLKYDKIFLERLIHGKISIYKSSKKISNTNLNSSADMDLHLIESCTFYAQKSNEASPIPITKPNLLFQWVQDCNSSATMINIDSKMLKKAIKKEPSFLNKVLSAYNNCH